MYGEDERTIPGTAQRETGAIEDLKLVLEGGCRLVSDEDDPKCSIMTRTVRVVGTLQSPNRPVNDRVTENETQIVSRQRTHGGAQFAARRRACADSSESG